MILSKGLSRHENWITLRDPAEGTERPRAMFRVPESETQPSTVTRASEEVPVLKLTVVVEPVAMMRSPDIFKFLVKV